MAKKAKRRVVYRYVRPRRRRRSDTTFKKIAGIGGYVLTEGIVENVLANTNINIPTDLVETGIGYYLMKKQRGVLGELGKVMFYVNAVQLARKFLGNINLGNLFSGVMPIKTEQKSNSVWD